jgi:3-hydroxyacyl-CoA dehydrogenase/enoyl-CoA hydratase/3-hydroxybutyryl-CoA epimerase
VYDGGKREEPDRGVYSLLGITSTHAADAKAVVERMVLPMINEAALILDDKIVGTPGELDLAMIMGTGFPPFRGGLLRYADKLGARNIVARLEDLAARVGPRFKPSAPLRTLAERDGKFYGAAS